MQGIGERSKFCDPTEEGPEGFPNKPSILTLEVNLIGVVWTTYLALHFFRKNEKTGGALVMTSSASALYTSPSLYLYAPAKHGVSLGTAGL
jgi:15-hydroxyprostaglandin dehydrogenase (NAD)